jgi:hypothetical protein
MALAITGARRAGEDVKRKLSAMVERQVRYAAFNALNDTVSETAEKVKEMMPDYIDRPTPYTQKRVLYQKAAYESRKDAEITASVYIPHFFGGKSEGRPAAKYMQYPVYGGARSLKGFEVALQNSGVLLPGEFVVPTRAVTLDAYGNVPRSFIQLILSWFRAAEQTSGYQANLSERTRKRLEGRRKYFDKQKNKLINVGVRKTDVTRPGFSPGIMEKRRYKYATTLGYQNPKRYGGQSFGRLFIGGRARVGKSYRHLRPGIYSAVGVHGVDIRPLFLFTRQPLYRSRFPFHKIVEQVAPRFLRNAFKRRFAEAMATARPE